ncbi:hypothetical protein DFJ73DRAFT_857144 [Zopfochytrium polystomum]|nr:hypothetical protein DFJ73DRAFT_857144 [Zopfochytrium polystomum]
MAASVISTSPAGSAWTTGQIVNATFSTDATPLTLGMAALFDLVIPTENNLLVSNLCTQVSVPSTTACPAAVTTSKKCYSLSCQFAVPAQTKAVAILVTYYDCLFTACNPIAAAAFESTSFTISGASGSSSQTTTSVSSATTSATTNSGKGVTTLPIASSSAVTNNPTTATSSSMPSMDNTNGAAGTTQADTPATNTSPVNTYIYIGAGVAAALLIAVGAIFYYRTLQKERRRRRDAADKLYREDLGSSRNASFSRPSPSGPSSPFGKRPEGSRSVTPGNQGFVPLISQSPVPPAAPSMAPQMSAVSYYNSSGSLGGTATGFGGSSFTGPATGYSSVPTLAASGSAGPSTGEEYPGYYDEFGNYHYYDPQEEAAYQAALAAAAHGVSM